MEVVLRKFARDDVDDDVREALVIFQGHFVAVELEKNESGGEPGAFIALLEGMVARDPEEKGRRQNCNVVFLLVIPEIARFLYRALKRAFVS